MGTPGTKLSRVLSALSSKTHQAEEKVTAANTGRGAPHGCADKEKKYGHISREQHRAMVWVSIIGDRANVAQRKIQGEESPWARTGVQQKGSLRPCPHLLCGDLTDSRRA